MLMVLNRYPLATPMHVSTRCQRTCPPCRTTPGRRRCPRHVLADFSGEFPDYRTKLKSKSSVAQGYIKGSMRLNHCGAAISFTSSLRFAGVVGFSSNRNLTRDHPVPTGKSSRGEDGFSRLNFEGCTHLSENGGTES